MRCSLYAKFGVYDGSKMKNFKQFTTDIKQGEFEQTVFMMVQR